MRVGFLSAMNYHSWGAFSGIVHAMHRALGERPGIELLDLGPTRRMAGFLGKVGGRLGWIRRDFDMKRAEDRERFRSHVQERLALTRPDVLFAPVSAVGVSLIETDLPVVYCSDATFRLLERTYRLRIPPELRELRQRSEEMAVQRATRLLYPSRWAADSALNDYGASVDRIDLAPFGANLPTIPCSEGLFERSPSRKSLRLLFVGTDYERKGGALALDMVAALRAQGCHAELTMVGSAPPRRTEGVTAITYLDKNSPKQAARLAEIYRSSHVFVLPTRADCSPVAICEAFAYGLPVVSTRVGGIPELAADDESLLLPLEVGGEEYAARILELIDQRDRYRTLAKACRRRFEEDLNWGAWSQRAERSLRCALEG